MPLSQPTQTPLKLHQLSRQWTIASLVEGLNDDEQKKVSRTRHAPV
jgi:hypothetical protein